MGRLSIAIGVLSGIAAAALLRDPEVSAIVGVMFWIAAVVLTVFGIHRFSGQTAAVGLPGVLTGVVTASLATRYGGAFASPWWVAIALAGFGVAPLLSVAIRRQYPLRVDEA